MEGTEITVTEKDLSEVLRVKVNEVTNLQVQLAALSRTVTEQNTQVLKLEAENKEKTETIVLLRNGTSEAEADYETGSSK
jgi:cell division protein FtsB